jgi:hypothetical protein
MDQHLAGANNRHSNYTDPRGTFRPQAHALAARRRARLFLVGLLPSSARLRFTGRLNRMRLPLLRKHPRTPEPCLENPIAELDGLTTYARAG